MIARKKTLAFLGCFSFWFDIFKVASLLPIGLFLGWYSVSIFDDILIENDFDDEVLIGAIFLLVLFLVSGYFVFISCMILLSWFLIGWVEIRNGRGSGDLGKQ